MELSANSIVEAVHEVFPECSNLTVTFETLLGELPEWDSMAAVNLQTFLLEQFGVEVPLEFMADETSLEDILTFLKNPVNSEAAY